MLKWFKRIVVSLFMVATASLIFAFSYEQVSRSRADRSYPPPGQFISLGNHQLHALVKGSGSPTVIFESGLGVDGHLSWYKVQDAVASFTQTVSYDRAGVFWSDRGLNNKTAAKISGELETMLKEGGFEPPYILVGHSLAGLTLRPFITDNRDDIAGVVFVDVSHPNQYEATPEELQGGGPSSDLVLSLLKNFGVLRYMMNSGPLPSEDPSDIYSTTVPSMIHRLQGMLDEAGRTEMIAKEVQSLRNFDDIPLVIITGASPSRNDKMNASEETREFMTNKWLEFQKDLLDLSSESKQILAMKSEHYVQISEPELVISSVRDLVERWKRVH